MKNKYRLLNHVNKLFEDSNLSQTLLISCQHLLGTQYLMFKRLFKNGLLPENTFIIGKNYSTNKSVYEKLTKLGCYVDEASIQYTPTISFDEWFSSKLRSFLKTVLSKVDPMKFRNIVVLDDGGMLIYEVANSSLPLEKVRAIEQTASGWNKLHSLSIPFDIFYVAKTKAKLMYETPFITKLCYERTIEHIRERGFENPKIFIIGNQGTLGKSLQMRFELNKFDVQGFDIKAGNFFEQFVEKINQSDIIIGTTGSQSVTEHQLQIMKPTVSLISVSSSDREFPALVFRKDGTLLHQNHFLDGKCLVNSGFPITFHGNYHELPPNQIEITCSLLLLGVYLATLGDDDWKTGNQFKSHIVKRLSTMYLEQVQERDYVYTT